MGTTGVQWCYTRLGGQPEFSGVIHVYGDNQSSVMLYTFRGTTGVQWCYTRLGGQPEFSGVIHV